MPITAQQAREQADETLRALYENVSDWDREVVKQAIQTIGSDGRAFSMNEIRDLLPEQGHGTAGLVLRSMSAQRPRAVVRVGKTPSTSGPTHGKDINVYVLGAFAHRAVLAWHEYLTRQQQLGVAQQGAAA